MIVRRLRKFKKIPTIKKSRTVQQMNNFVETVPTEEWRYRDFIDFIYFMKTIYLGQMFRPVYGHNQYLMKSFVDRYGKKDSRDIIEGLFLFRSHFTDRHSYLGDLFTLYPIRSFASSKLDYIFSEALNLIKNYQKELNIPNWKKKHQSEWNEKDWQEFRDAVKDRGKIYG